MQTAKFLSTVHALILLTTVLLAVPASHAASATVLAGQSVSFPGILGTIVGATELCDGLLGEDVDLFRELQAVQFG